METLADETNNFPRLVIVFDPPNPSTTLSRIDAVLPATLNLENVFVVRTATPESPNLTVGELLNRIRTYITAVPPPSRVIPSISSLPMPASQPPVTPQTPIVFLSQFSPPEVQQVISACRSLNEDFAFALEVRACEDEAKRAERRVSHSAANLTNNFARRRCSLPLARV